MVQIRTLVAECQHAVGARLFGLEDRPLEIAGLGDGEHLGMVLALAQNPSQADAAGDSGRRIRLRRVLGQAEDHPEVLTIPETGYLKGAILEAE